MYKVRRRGRFAKNSIIAICLPCSRILNCRGLPDYFWKDDERRFTQDAAEVELGSALSSDFVTSALPVPRGPLLLPKEEISSDTLEKEQARLDAAFEALEQQPRTDEPEQQTRTAALEPQASTENSVQVHFPDAAPRKRNFSDLAYYVFSEIPPDEKPADTLLGTMKSLPIGTPVEEIKHASDAFGLDFNFMKAVAKIKSGFNPKQRTGSYIGLFQLSKYEFKQYGSGNITDPRTMPLPALTNLPRRPCSLNSGPAKNRLSVICT